MLLFCINVQSINTLIFLSVWLFHILIDASWDVLIKSLGRIREKQSRNIHIIIDLQSEFHERRQYLFECTVQKVKVNDTFIDKHSTQLPHEGGMVVYNIHQPFLMQHVPLKLARYARVTKGIPFFIFSWPLHLRHFLPCFLFGQLSNKNKRNCVTISSASVSMNYEHQHLCSIAPFSSVIVNGSLQYLHPSRCECMWNHTRYVQIGHFSFAKCSRDIVDAWTDRNATCCCENGCSCGVHFGWGALFGIESSRGTKQDQATFTWISYQPWQVRPSVSACRKSRAFPGFHW